MRVSATSRLRRPPAGQSGSPKHSSRLHHRLRPSWKSCAISRRAPRGHTAPPRNAMELAETLFSTPDMAAVLSGQTHVRYMLAFEAALALAEARVGVIPEVAADDIAACCRIEKFDVRQLYADALPAVPDIPLCSCAMHTLP